MTLAWATSLPAGDKLVLLALADCANDEGRCWPGIKGLCAKTGKSERSLQGAIKALCETGHLTRDEVAGKGCNYTVHPRNNCAPAKSAPPQKTTKTPAKSAGKPSRTIIASEAKASSAVRATYPAPSGVPESVWADFLKSPKRRKAGMSDTAYAGIKNNLTILAEHGFPPGEMIALAVERGWTTVKLEWVLNDNDRRTNSMAGHQPSDGLSNTARAGIAVFGH